MGPNFPAYLNVDAEQLGRGHEVRVRVVRDAQALAEDMARAMAEVVSRAATAGRGATLIVPVGPVDQFPVLADIVNRQRVSLRDVVLINMDEYLTDDDRWLPLEHPLSFRGFMDRSFYGRLDPPLAPAPEQRVFPDPRDPEVVQCLIEARGGVDACFGGIGINGHIAFNEPPEPGMVVTNDEFAALPTRALSLARETRTINAHTVGGSIDVVPRRCVTVGMREILASRRLRFYCNRPWQSAVVRKALFGPVSPECPASFLRTHADAELTITEQVASRPEIGLR
jgi:glucosamine-6-phosphate deaminase